MSEIFFKSREENIVFLDSLFLILMMMVILVLMMMMLLIGVCFSS